MEYPCPNVDHSHESKTLGYHKGKSAMRRTKTITLSRFIDYLDDYLRIPAIPDRSLNGLQVEGAKRIRRAAFAVDACLKTIATAGRIHADILVVHHGLFWGRNERVTGVMRRRIAALIENNVSLYAAHLPLDCHEEVGNNAQLARLLGFDLGQRFADYHGVEIGFVADSAQAMSRTTLAKKIEKTLKSPVDRLDFGPTKTKRVGIVSGEAAGYAAEAKELGCDAFVTGETSHTAYHLAKEARINVIFAGHYASETVGVKALAGHLKNKLSLECRFISAPTGY
jgi:dinuclear metal center YbgI/SA1388 family protein